MSATKLLSTPSAAHEGKQLHFGVRAGIALRGVRRGERLPRRARGGPVVSPLSDFSAAAAEYMWQGSSRGELDI